MQRENHEEQVVAGIHRREDQNEDRAEIDDSFAREAIVHLIDEPAQTSTPRERRDDRDRHPAGHAERYDCGAGSNPNAAGLRSGGGEKRDEQRNGEHQHRDAEIFPAGTIASPPPSCCECFLH